MTRASGRARSSPVRACNRRRPTSTGLSSGRLGRCAPAGPIRVPPRTGRAGRSSRRRGSARPPHHSTRTRGDQGDVRRTGAAPPSSRCPQAPRRARRGQPSAVTWSSTPSRASSSCRPAGEQRQRPGVVRSTAVTSGTAGALELWLPDRRRSAHAARLVRFGPLDRVLPLNGRPDRYRSPAGSPGRTACSLSRNWAASSARDPTPSLA